MSTRKIVYQKRLRGLGFGSYSDYLRSEHWYYLKEVLIKAG